MIGVNSVKLRCRCCQYSFLAVYLCHTYITMRLSEESSSLNFLQKEIRISHLWKKLIHQSTTDFLLNRFHDSCSFILNSILDFKMLDWKKCLEHDLPLYWRKHVSTKKDGRWPIFEIILSYSRSLLTSLDPFYTGLKREIENRSRSRVSEKAKNKIYCQQ